MLFQQHASIPRNRSLANLFFRAGYIESWGRGTIAIAQECFEYGLPAPSFNEKFGGFTVEFRKPHQDTPQDGIQDGMQDGIHESIQDEVHDLGNFEISEVQMRILVFCEQAKAKGAILNHIGLSNYYKNFKTHIFPLIQKELLSMTSPQKPTSKNQKYRLTQKGKLYRDRR
jgi:ATP-dependent DNA helicase RecG